MLRRIFIYILYHTLFLLLLYSRLLLCFFFFFFLFQAEDGIRDYKVIQTCALPISRSPSGISTCVDSVRVICGGTRCNVDCFRQRATYAVANPFVAGAG